MKQYDLLIGESGGKEEKKSHLNEVFQNMLDEAFNVGIDQAIRSAKNYCEELKQFTRKGQPYFSESHINELISILESLKKPTV